MEKYDAIIGAVTPMTPHKFAEFVERRINFVAENKDGSLRSVRMPPQFLNHYRHYVAEKYGWHRAMLPDEVFKCLEQLQGKARIKNNG
jgi:hypothetical protein